MPAQYLATGHAAGEECSSTYEGRHITIEEGLLIHPANAPDGFVNKGDPVIAGLDGEANIVGVAFTSAAAASDLIAIDTEGIWFLNVLGCISDGTANGAAYAMSLGDPVYIDKVTAALSGQNDAHLTVPFGYVLGSVNAHLTVPTLVAVKVHAAPNFLKSVNAGVFGDNLEIDLVAVKAAGQPEAAWMQAYIKPSTKMAAAGDRLQGIKIRLEDTLAATGGDLQGIRTQVHCNNANGVWTRLYGQYIAIANTASSAITESFGLSINMGGAGCAPAMQSVFQVMGDGTLGTKQGWFQTEIGRGAGLKADATSINVNRTHEIPIYIDGNRYCIPVIAWV